MAEGEGETEPYLIMLRDITDLTEGVKTANDGQWRRDIV